MDLDLEWKIEVEEKFFQEEDPKEEKKYLINQAAIMIKFESLNKSEQFIRILKKKKLSGKYFTIYFDKFRNSNNNLNISFVMKKKIGNAVKRNKIKRKLKAAVQKISKEKHLINLNYIYVIFGKNNVYKDNFEFILGEVSKTFKKINSYAWKY